MDAVTPKGAQTADTHSHLFAPTAWNGRRRAFPAAKPRRCCSTARPA